MCGDDIRSRIICRMLYRCEGVDFFSDRKYDNTTRVLSRGSSHTHAPLYDPVNLTISLPLIPLFIIFFYIAKCSFISQRTDRSCTEGLPCSENYLRILMSFTLVFTGEIQVDIRLLVSFKSQKGLKGNVKSLFFQLRPAFRAVFIRHIAACHSGIFFYLLRVKITVMAIRTVIMGT